DSWEEALALAGSINGTQAPCIDDSSQTCNYYGFCFGLPDGCFYDGLALSAIWATMVGSYGTKSGLFFNPVNMQALFTGPAMAEAIRIFRRLAELGPLGLGPCGRLPVNAYVKRCFMGLAMASSFKEVSAAFAYGMGGKLGTSMLPGSHVVQSRTSGQLELCTRALCPYGTFIHSDVHNGAVLISRVPYLGRGAFSFSVNRKSKPNHALAALRAITFILTYKDGWGFTTDPGLETLTVRTSHLSPQSIDMWTSAGYNKSDTLEFMAVIADSIGHPCMALPLRLPGGGDIATAMSLVAADAAVNSTSADVLLKVLQDHFNQMLRERYGGDLSLLQQAYWRDIGYNRGSPAGYPLLPPGQSAPQTAQSEGGGNGLKLSTGAILALAVTAAAACLVLMGAAAACTIHRERQLRRDGRRKVLAAPSYSCDSSLCITDIQSSTNLWEDLPTDVMDSGLSIHNGCVRGLLSKHQGYECHTEGDSFVCAFSSAVEAVNFALELQVALMQLPWPQLLLQHPECACVYQSLSGGPPGNGGGVIGGGGGSGAGVGAGGGVGGEYGGGAGGCVDGPGSGLAPSARSHTAMYLHPLMLLAHSPRGKSNRPLDTAGAGTSGGDGCGSSFVDLHEQSTAASMVVGVPNVPPRAQLNSAQGSMSDRVPSGYSRGGRQNSARSAIKPWGAAASAGAMALTVETSPPSRLPAQQQAVMDNEPGRDEVTSWNGATAAATVVDMAAISRATAAIVSAPVAAAAAAAAGGPLTSAATSPFTGPAAAAARTLSTNLSVTNTTTLTIALASASGVSSQQPSGRVLVFRGFRVRVGICSGLTPGRDLVYCKDLSRRTAYSGVCMQLTKMISDAALGGMVLVSESTAERLLPLPRRDMPGLILWHKGRFKLINKEKNCSRKPGGARPAHTRAQTPSQSLSLPTPRGSFTWMLRTSLDSSCEIQDLYQAMPSSLEARQQLLDRVPLRTGPQLLPGILAAPIGDLTLALVQVVG
ncbi:hypothetical protein Vretifemale_11263, partial [Volvox reticuliferus]